MTYAGSCSLCSFRFSVFVSWPSAITKDPHYITAGAPTQYTVRRVAGGPERLDGGKGGICYEAEKRGRGCLRRWHESCMRRATRKRAEATPRSARRPT